MKKIRKSGEERGVALVAALFALLLLSAVAMGMMYATNTESSIDMNFRDMQRASYSAQAGLEEARERIRTGALNHINPPLGLPDTSSQNVIYIVNPATVQPWNNYPDAEVRSEFSNLTASTTSQACAAGTWCGTSASTFSTGAPLDYKWVRITRKANNSTRFPVDSNNPTLPTQVCWDGKKQVLLPSGSKCEDVTSPSFMQPVYLITSYAVTPSGATQTAQMEISPGLPIAVDAAVVSQDDVTLKGSYVLNGYDNCTCHLVSGVYQSRSGKICDNTKWALKTAGIITTNGSSGDSIAGVTPTQVQHQTWNYDIPGLINTYKTQATVFPAGTSCTSGNCGTLTHTTMGTYPTGVMPDDPTGADPKVTYFPGSVKLRSSPTGAGILIVDGDLEINGGLNFYGLILVKGIVSFTGGASEDVNLYGAILAGQEVGATDTDLGGSVSLQYDSCALRQFDPTVQPFTVLSRREIQF